MQMRIKRNFITNKLKITSALKFDRRRYQTDERKDTTKVATIFRIPILSYFQRFNNIEITQGSEYGPRHLKSDSANSVKHKERPNKCDTRENTCMLKGFNWYMYMYDINNNNDNNSIWS